MRISKILYGSMMTDLFGSEISVEFEDEYVEVSCNPNDTNAIKENRVLMSQVSRTANIMLGKRDFKVTETQGVDSLFGSSRPYHSIIIGTGRELSFEQRVAIDYSLKKFLKPNYYEHHENPELLRECEFNLRAIKYHFSESKEKEILRVYKGVAQ